MRILITLSVLQTIGIAVLVVHALGEEQHPAADTPRAQDALERLAQEHNRPVAASLPAVPAPSRNPSAAELHGPIGLDLLRGEVALLKQELQADIAKLDAVSRKQMLGKLTRALNTGDLKGRL